MTKLREISPLLVEALSLTSTLFKKSKSGQGEPLNLSLQQLALAKEKMKYRRERVCLQ